jgi:sialidase-1
MNTIFLKGIIPLAAIICSMNVAAQVNPTHAFGDSVDLQSGKKTTTGFWIHDKTKDLGVLRSGPFIQLSKKKIATVDSTCFLVSNDDGISWRSSPIFKDNSKFFIRPERALIRTKKGTLILAFANDKERANWNWSKDSHDSPEAVLPTYAVRSEDDGKTWSEPALLHKDWTGAIRDIIETTQGNIVFSSMMMRHNPGHHAVVTYSSSDEGRSWKRSNIIDLGGVGDHDGVTESTLEQMKDGSMKMLLRTNWGYFWETQSTDNGLTWNNIKSTSIDASSSPGMLKRLKSGRLVLVWNRYYPQGKNSYPLRGGDNNFSATPVSMHREEISIMFSEDDGNNWSKPVVIGKTLAPKTQIAYPYVFERKPGELWISFAFSTLRLFLREKDFIQ